MGVWSGVSCTLSTPTTWKGGRVRAQCQDGAWGLREVTHVEVAVHVEPHDAEVIGARDVRDDALPAFPLLRHPHPHVPVPELGRRNCHSHSSLGTSFGIVAIQGPFWLPTSALAPLAPACLGYFSQLSDQLHGPQVTLCPNPYCLGILPSSAGRASASPEAVPTGTR